MFKTLVEFHTSVPSTYGSAGEGLDEEKKKKKERERQKEDHISILGYLPLSAVFDVVIV